MIEQYNSIEIEGRKFKRPTTFDFFQSAKNRIALVFGRNGAGKSTIADALRKGTDEADAIDDVSANLMGANVPSIALNGKASVAPCKIHVFDERFTDKYCRLAETGLKTIVLMGEAGELHDDIETLERDIKQAKTDKEHKEEARDAHLDRYHRPPSDRMLRDIEATLKSDSCWAGREKQIHGAEHHPILRDSIKQSIYNHTSTRSLADVRTAFEDKLHQLTIAQQSATEDFSAWPALTQPHGLSETIAKFHEMMARTVNQPASNETSSRILEIMRLRHHEWLQDAKNTFGGDTHYCPFCARSIDENEKRDLIENIKSVLNEGATNLANDLNALQIEDITQPPVEYRRLDATLWMQISDDTAKINGILKYYRECRATRLQNVYEIIPCEVRDLTTPLTRLSASIAQMQEQHRAVLEDLNREVLLEKELTAINLEYSYLEIRDQYRCYKLQKGIDDQMESAVFQAEQALGDLVSQKRNLEARLAQVTIAVDEINKLLSRVFLSSKRLSIQHENGAYTLKVNEKNVKLTRISTGERNIIALCYFFVHIMSGETIDNFMADEHLIVLDDPISSFDADVRMGVLALINERIRQLLEKNANTRILIMTHDYHASYELFIAFKPRFGKFLSLRELRDDSAIDGIKFDKFNEYILLLKEIYKFADGNQAPMNFVLGNVMRRVLEAYSTFLYKSGFEELFDSEFAQEKLKQYHNYFATTMARFVANDESHSFSHVRELIGGIALVDTLTDDQRRQAAKDVICLLYLYDPYHIKNYLGEEIKDLEQTIARWLAALPTHNG